MDSNPHQSSGQLLTFLTNLTNLTNLLSRNLGKTQWLSYRKNLHRRCKIQISHPPPSTTRCIIVPLPYTGRERLIRSHSSARFCFELSGNSN